MYSGHELLLCAHGLLDRVDKIERAQKVVARALEVVMACARSSRGSLRVI